MEHRPETKGDGYMVEGDPEETAEQERERLREDSAERERAEIRSGMGAGEGPNDEPAAGKGVNRGGYAPRSPRR